MSALPAPVRSLGVAGPGAPRIIDLSEHETGSGPVLVRTLYSGVSAGTELTFVKGTNPYLSAAFDRELRVFRHDRAPSSSYPVRAMGYMEVGRVVGGGSAELPDGALVACAYGHRTAHRVDPARDVVVPLPADLDPVLGVFVAQMGPICANGLLHAAADVPGGRDLGDGVRGRSVLVTGAGVVGLLTALFARWAGAARVAVADPTPARLAVARALGLETFDDRAGEAAVACKEAWAQADGDRGADVAFQCRGQDTALRTALRALRPQGTVVDLAFYPGGAAAVRLGEEFHHNGLTIRCAQIARVPRAMAGRWDRRRLCAATLGLLSQDGAALRRHVVTDLVALQDGPALLLALARRERAALQVVLQMPAEETAAAGVADGGRPADRR